MSEDKNKKPEIIDADDFESVEPITEVEVIEPGDEDNKKVDAPEVEAVVEEELVMTEDLVMDADDVEVTDIPPVDGGMDKNVVDEDAISAEDIPELDDFDDLEEELAAVSVSSATKKSSGGAGKIAVGLIALLAAGAGGYYFLSGSSSNTVPVNAPVVMNEPVVEETVDPVADQVVDMAMAPQDNIEVSVDVVEDDSLSFDDEQEDLSSDAFVEEDGDDMFAEQDALSVTVDGVADAEVVEEGGSEPDVELSMDVADIEPAPAIDDAVDVLSVDVEEDEVVSVDEAPSYPAETTVVSGVAPSDMPSDMKAVEDDPAVIVVAEEEPIVEVSDELTVSPSEEVLIDIVDEQPVDGGNVGVLVKPEVYFDSVENVVQRDSSLQAVGPSEVDPIAEPASKYLVVSDVKPKNSIESQIQQARRALKLGRYDAAYDFYERLYKKSPKDEAILMGRAVSLQKLGRETAAISAYEELLNLYPKNADALVNMLGLVKGQYPAVALQKLLSIRQDHPQNAGVAAQIGLTYAAMNNFNDARRYLNIAMGIEPENAQHLYNIAVVFDREGVRDKAIEYYDKALRVDAVHGGGRSINREVIYDRLAKLR